jgi:hypothetical protein
MKTEYTIESRRQDTTYYTLFIDWPTGERSRERYIPEQYTMPEVYRKATEYAQQGAKVELLFPERREMGRD